MNSTKSKAQVAFEFILVLSIILFLSSVIMMDFFNEANKSIIGGQVKNVFESKVAALSIGDKACLGTYLESFEIEDNKFFVTIIGPCKLKYTHIAREIEQQLCNQPGNYNNLIECPPYEYIVKMIWKENKEE